MMNRESHQTDAIATATTKTSSRSSTSGEEGFVSGSSLSDMDTVDNLAQQLYELSVGSVFSVLDKPLTTGKTTFAQKVLSNPDGAASIQTPSAVDGSSTLMAAVGTRSSAAGSRATTIAFHSSAASISTSASSVASIPATQQQQLPGAWFYEIGPTSDDANSTDSPVAEHINNDDPSMYYFRCNGIAPAMERVLVPSSEHVAEIVGRQGCKIKALRAKLDVFIRSPPRGEDPVFVITGRPDDVMEARREIELAAEHFTQIRASRRHSQGGCPAPGHVTTYVRVPLRVVGLVVGPKGATVKRIQQNTQTYIQTPSREREPVFEVTGLPHNVESARREIEHHIFQRTGNMPITLDPSVSLQNFDSYGALSHINNGGASHRMTPSFPTFGCGAPNATAYRGNENVYHGGGNSYGSMNSVGYMRSGLGKTYSAAGSPPPYFNDVLATRGSSNSTVNNENVFTVGNWQPQESSANRYFHDFVLENSKTTNPTTTNNNNNNNNNSNAFGSSNHYLGTNANNSNYLSSLSSSVTSRDEGLGDSPSWYTKMNGDAYRLLSSIWSDPDATPSNGVDGRGLAPQLASA